MAGGELPSVRRSVGWTSKIVHHFCCSSRHPENIPDAKLLRKRKEGSAYGCLKRTVRGFVLPTRSTDCQKNFSNMIEELLALPSVAALPIVSTLRQALADKESRYKADSQLRGLRDSLDRTLVNVGNMVIKSYEASKATEAKLTAALQEQEQAALELNKIAIPYNALVREVETDRALYESVLTRMKVTNVARGIWDNDIRVIEYPLVAAKPAKPAKLKILALALLGGFVIGCGMVTATCMGDSTMRSVDQVEQILGLPSLTSVPESKRKDLDKTSVLISDPGSHEAEAFRSLRTALSFLGHERDCKTILFTNSNPAEGKTYCSFNFAVALAQTGPAHSANRRRPAPAELEQTLRRRQKNPRIDRLSCSTCIRRGLRQSDRYR